MATPTQLPSGLWRIQISINNTRESSTHRTKREASQWAERRSLELRAERKGTAGELKTLRDTLKRFSEEVCPGRGGCDWEQTRIHAFMGPKHTDLPLDLLLAKLGDQHFKVWRDARSLAVKPGTVRREMTLLYSVLEHARKEWKWVNQNPMQDVTRPSQPAHRERVISWSEQRRMLRALGYRTQGRQTSMSGISAAAFLLALRTGMRAGEITGLEWSNVFDNWLRLPKTKNGQKRDVPLPPRTMRLIQRMRGLDDELVFPVRTQSLDALFRKARNRIGLSGFTFHDSRHTAATRVGRTVGQPGKLTFPEFCKVFGWRDFNNALVYVNPTAADLALKMT